jgi:hypothetical protein
VRILLGIPGWEFLILLETGHFALEEDGAVIAELIIRFLTTHLPA